MLSAVAVAFVAVAGAAFYTVHRVLKSGVTRSFDDQFGDQHLKTTVALVELHKTRNGTYPRRLSELKFTGEWDALALGSVSYCANEDTSAYYVEVQRGWIGKPDLTMPAGFWRGTGFRETVGPCKQGP